ncbi:MAG TPA: DUF1549 domain-containing protein [Pirellulales bacterium]|jgi:mono/diheme cytochrome c family protein|nr:DUF1549 domain-containing protein [Pirellulales bacterium]
MRDGIRSFLRRGLFGELGLIGCLFVSAIAVVQAADKPTLPADHAERMTKGLAQFQKEISAILKDHCLKCHGGEKTSGEFDLATREGLLKGGETGQDVVPFDSHGSLLYKLITHADEPKMPDKGPKLSDETIAKIAEWIDNGAPYDQPLAPGKASAKSKVVTAEDKRWWSFQPLAQEGPPKLSSTLAPLAQNAVDQFILAKAQPQGLTYSPAADRRILVRRAYLDLWGLPPTPAEVDEFIQDGSPDAWPKLIDRLLASPHYGERWARHWLDVARFAESSGFEHDYDRPGAWIYRDFVIRALNSDMPFNQFLHWQLAGDEYAPDDVQALAATGFLGAGVFPTQITANEVERTRYDALDDMLSTTSSAFLGLTVGCARCHDHKYDPIPTRDYYRLLSTFTTTVRSNIEVDLDPEKAKRELAEWTAADAPLAAALRDREAALRAKFDEDRKQKEAAGEKPLAEAEQKKLFEQAKQQDDAWKKRHAEVEAHAKKKPARTTILICGEGYPALRYHTQGADFFHETYILERGSTDRKKEVATQSYLEVLMPGPDAAEKWHWQPPAGAKFSGRRRSLAEWLTDVDSGAGSIVARVIVNRLWQHHFHQGIVASPNDFGHTGTPPSQPELLDWLARELIHNGWKLKPLHKLLMTSAAYMQATSPEPQTAQKEKLDPANGLFVRRQTQRLEGEPIRDSILAVAGTLDPAMYGPGVHDEKSLRRSIYFTVKRSQLMGSMVVFDQPEPLVSQGSRPTTTVAPQALLLLNGPQVRAAAEAFARRIEAQAPVKDDFKAAVERAYSAALCRAPTADELRAAVQFLDAQAASYQTDAKPNGRSIALSDFCQVLFGLNEFAYEP